VELPPSVPLAAVRYPIYEQVEIEIEPRATLVLYTDGLIERSGESLDTGLERLRVALADGRHEPQALCDTLVSTLLPAGTGADDAAILIVTVPALSDPFEMRLPADPDSITLVRRVVGRWLDQAGASAEEIGELTLACSEACANAIEHAYGPDTTDFEVVATQADDAVTLTVRDAGQWRDPRGTNRGRGLTLMHGLVDEVDVQSGDSGTEVHLTRRLGRVAA